MRVLDAGSTLTYKMGKNRKHRIRKNKENEAEESSDDGAAICPHIAKAVNFAAMRKMLLKPTVNFNECSTCAREATSSGAKDLFGSPLEGAAASAVEDSDQEATIWVCLQCGIQGCDRNSREKHALKHFEAPHSGIHCVVVNLTTWTAWCYSCDNDIPVENSKRILECVDFLRKQAGLPRFELSHFSGQRGLQPASQSDASPTDPMPPASQSRADKSQVAGRTSVVSCQKVKGLNNLGNTCFFNAVMQNLCQTHSLEAQLITCCKKGRSISVGGWREPHTDSDSSGDEDEEGKSKELSMIEIVSGDAGPLTRSLLDFVQEMNNGSSNGTVSPNTLFSHVCKKAPRFKGFQQQDSHELLRYLVDVVRNEEIKRAQSGILKYFKLPESVNPKKVDEDTKTKIKEYGRQVKFTFLDSLFGGQLVSTVTCEECKHISQVFEPFLDLSLPVTEEKPQRPNQMQGARRKEVAAAADTQQEAAAPAIGVDGFADRGDKPNKRQERKNKKQAKKDAKRKPKATRKGSSMGPGKSIEADDEDKDGGREEEDHGAGSGVKECGESQPGSSNNGGDGDDDNSSPHEDPSDADVEDNVESETSKLQIVAADYDSNLTSTSRRQAQSNNLQNNHCDSDGDASSATDMSIKGGTIKENHILPNAGELSQSGDSQPASLDSVNNTGIKEESRDMEKLANGVSNLELETKSENTQDPAESTLENPIFQKSLTRESNHVDKGTVGKELTNHCDVKVENCVGDSLEPHPYNQQQGLDGVNDSVRREGIKGSMFEAGDGGAMGLEKDFEEKLILSADTTTTTAGGGVALPHSDKNTSVPNHRAGKPLKDLHHDAKYKAKCTLAHRYLSSSKECSVMSCLHQFTAAELLTGSNKVGCKVCTRTRPKNASSHKDKKGSDTVYSNAAKQFLILIPPAVLTLHLKRFEQVGFTSRKVNRHVDFPLVLDLAPYCSSLCQDVKRGQRKVLYSLYGVVEHSGRLQGGHYTAYVKVRPSLGPLTNFLHSHPPNPLDLFHRYMEHIQNGPSIAEEDASDGHPAETLVPPGRWFHVSDSRINEVTETTVLKAQAYLLFYERVY